MLLFSDSLDFLIPHLRPPELEKWAITFSYSLEVSLPQWALCSHRAQRPTPTLLFNQECIMSQEWRQANGVDMHTAGRLRDKLSTP